jgi:CysZ protein
MVKALLLAFGDLFSPEFRGVLFRALGLTLALFIVVMILAQFILVTLTNFSWPWADELLGLGLGLALFVAFFFLMGPVIAIFAGFFLDQVAALVEQRHYPSDPPGSVLPMVKSILFALKFFVLVLAVNLAVLPVVILGVGAVALVAANAYLIGREYFEMVAMRHLPAADAREVRKQNGPAIFFAGLVPAVFSLIPVLNLAVPLFATSYFTHLFKSVRASSA